MALAAGLALGSMWVGIALAYWLALPPGATIALVAAACYGSSILL
jgi:ABC-type Mn2+/Zn2+ transport system permease subunit